MTLVQKIMYVHHRFQENEFVVNVQLKTECAQTIQLKDGGKNDDSVILNQNENMFQFAFRTREILDMVAEVFKKFKAGEVKGQKSAKALRGKGKSKAKEVIEALANIKMTEWKYM
jgi:hypothetical protein